MSHRGAPTLQVQGLSHAYGATPVLREVSFDVAPGEVVAVIGPSGAGKTTLFRSITGLVAPSGGRALVAGRDLATLGGRELARARRQVGLIFQQYNLVRRLSAADNVVIGRLVHLPTWRAVLRRPGADERARAVACLDRVGMAAHARARADTLSGGQQQRVAIARVLAQRSSLLLADEPVASLDPASAASVLATLRAIASDHGIAVVCSLHQVELVGGFADRVVGLGQGRVTLDVPVADFGDDHRAAVYGARLAPSLVQERCP
ncbi:MAG: phosphonate ABC transporter ATP-binding protein [Actinomycetota bacterium]|nr:phosphonate ABC transporter ATP-binding protein [Actinomycetota bacterium]